MTPFIRKFVAAAVVATVVSWIVYPLMCWIVIFPFGPAHSEVAPQQVFHEAVSGTLMIGVLFAGVQLVALLCAVSLVAKASFRLVALVAGAVPALALPLSLVLRDWISFATPMRAARVVLLVLAFTFALLYIGVRSCGSHARKAAS